MGWEGRAKKKGGKNLGFVPSGRCVNPCDAAILRQRALLLDNIRGPINRLLICKSES